MTGVRAISSSLFQVLYDEYDVLGIADNNNDDGKKQQLRLI
jgi:hypothetical protein